MFPPLPFLCPSTVNDTLDEIFDASGDEEESQDIVNQVLDEIGIEISGKVRKTPGPVSLWVGPAGGIPLADVSLHSWIFNFITGGDKLFHPSVVYFHIPWCSIHSIHSATACVDIWHRTVQRLLSADQ